MEVLGVAHRHLRPSLLLGPTPSHSILRNSLQVGETLPIKGQSSFHNHHPHQSYNNRNLVLKQIMFVVVFEHATAFRIIATFMPGSSPSHYLQTALKGGFYKNTSGFELKNQLLGLANTNTQLLGNPLTSSFSLLGLANTNTQLLGNPLTSSFTQTHHCNL
ncbi:hypothetical protein YC2023_049006 [Brassica napus]